MRFALNAVLLVLLMCAQQSCIRRPSHLAIDRCIKMETDLFCLDARNVELGPEPLTLDRMIEIALCRNLDLLVKAQEIKVQKEATFHQSLNTLPSLVASYDNWGRDKNTASFSESLEPGIPPAPLSISSETHIELANLEFTWNILDFGVAYYRTRQELNSTLMEEMQYSRIRQNLILEITKQYWKAALAKMVIDVSEELYSQSEKLRGRLQEMIDQGELSSYLGYQIIQDLLENEVILSGYPKEYQTAKSELLKLMGVLPDQDFEIAVESFEEGIFFPTNLEQLEKMALANRPELYSVDFEENKMRDEVYIAFLRMFPNVEFFEGTFTDQNRFLLFNSWKRAGLRATWDLLNLPARSAARSVAQRKVEQVRTSRLSLSFAVLAQVNLAYHMIYDLQKQYEIAEQWHEANQKLVHTSKRLYEHGEINQAELIDDEFQAILARIAWFKSGAELRVAMEQLSNAIGLPGYIQHLGSFQEIDEFDEIEMIR